MNLNWGSAQYSTSEKSISLMSIQLVNNSYSVSKFVTIFLLTLRVLIRVGVTGAAASVNSGNGVVSLVSFNPQ